MREVIDLDLEVLEALAELAHEYWVEARPVRPIEVVREYRKTVTDERTRCARPATPALKRNFAGSPLLLRGRRSTGTLPPKRPGDGADSRRHRQPGRRIARRGTDIAKLGENGVEIFFTQVFRHIFFSRGHAPRQYFCAGRRPEESALPPLSISGIVGTLQPAATSISRRKLHGFFQPRLWPNRPAAHRERLGAQGAPGG